MIDVCADPIAFAERGGGGVRAVSKKKEGKHRVSVLLSLEQLIRSPFRSE